MRLHRQFALAILCGACCAYASPSRAGCPSVGNSLVPPVIAACPSGDIAYTVTILDATNSPRYGIQVALDFSACPGVHFCPSSPATQYVYLTPTSVAVTTDVTGRATFWLEAGGTCTAGVQVTFICYGVPFLLTNGIDHLPVSFAGLDQDGDLDVTAADATILAAKGPSDPTADLNADGVHDAADAALLAAHETHMCPAIVTPTIRGSWGRLKIFYR